VYTGDNLEIKDMDIHCAEGVEICVTARGNNISFKNIRLRHSSKGMGIYFNNGDGFTFDGLDVATYGTTTGPNPCP